MENAKILKLVRFLKEKGIYGEFSKNFREQFLVREKWLKMTTRSYYSDVIEYELINYAFSWIDTKQGYDFWENVANEWKKKVIDDFRSERTREI